LTFEHRGPQSILSKELDPRLQEAEKTFESNPEPVFGKSSNKSELIRLRRMEMWYRRTDKILEDRLSAIKGSSAERELQCKKILAMSTGLPMDQVEQMTGSLLLALESEPAMGDLNRISNFMQKVKEGEKEPSSIPWSFSR